MNYRSVALLIIAPALFIRWAPVLSADVPVPLRQFDCDNPILIKSIFADETGAPTASARRQSIDDPKGYLLLDKKGNLSRSEIEVDETDDSHAIVKGRVGLPDFEDAQLFAKYQLNTADHNTVKTVEIHIYSVNFSEAKELQSSTCTLFEQ